MTTTTFTSFTREEVIKAHKELKTELAEVSFNGGISTADVRHRLTEQVKMFLNDESGVNLVELLANAMLALDMMKASQEHAIEQARLLRNLANDNDSAVLKVEN